MREFGRPEAENYSEEGMWRKMCECKEIDLIYICTDWLTHTDLAVYALQQGRHVALAVPAAMSVADCWRLVDPAEETRRHCMMLENCCYDAFALTTLNMVQQLSLIHILKLKLQNLIIIRFIWQNMMW